MIHLSITLPDETVLFLIVQNVIPMILTFQLIYSPNKIFMSFSFLFLFSFWTLWTPPPLLLPLWVSSGWCRLPVLCAWSGAAVLTLVAVVCYRRLSIPCPFSSIATKQSYHCSADKFMDLLGGNTATHASIQTAAAALQPGTPLGFGMIASTSPLCSPLAFAMANPFPKLAYLR